MHVGKTGGTALKALVDSYSRDFPGHQIVVRPHVFRLPRILKEFPDSKTGFCVREPVDRFLSGFYSRQRKGFPRYNNEWTPAEKKAFTDFGSPEALGLGLASPDSSVREKAEYAMNAIGHTRMGLAHYLVSARFLERIKDKILFIGHQPDFDQDVDWIRQVLGIPQCYSLPDDDIGAHRNPIPVEDLSEVARKALTEWYADDYPIYEWCLKRRDELKAAALSN